MSKITTGEAGETHRRRRIERHYEQLIAFISPPQGIMFPILFLSGGFFFASILFTIAYSLQSGNTLTLSGWDLANYESLLTGDLYRQFLSDTALLSGVTVVVTFFISYPAAYALSRKIEKFKGTMLVVLIIPLITDINIRIYGWVIFLVKDGVLSNILSTVGVAYNSIMYTYLSTVIGMSYVYLPFMLFPLYLSFESLNDELFEVATDLGASRWQSFRTVVLPLSVPGILIGSLLTFLLSLGAEVESSMLGGESIITMANDITYSFGYQQNWGLGSAKAMLMLAFAIIAGTVILNIVDLQEIAGRDA
jgi:spermidine/putrescine transport system permease protein